MVSTVQNLRRSSDSACEAAIAEALLLYGSRAVENLDLSKLLDSRSRARVLGRKLMEQGDARAFAMGRELVAMGESRNDGTD
jgi:hypothetical protein